MTQEEKDLLLKDLCGRLPYYTIINVNNGKYREDVKLHPHYIFDWDAERWDAKPYLRPMSSMTNDERFEYLDFLKVEIQDGGYVTENYVVSLADMPMLIDWLNAHHFDYRGLIKMGLALEAPEGMYNF